MKSNIILVFVLISSLVACDSVGKKHQDNRHEEHSEHLEEGLVVLGPHQREALDLQLGTFQKRNLTTIVKVNGQLEVPPSSSAEVAAIVGGNVKEIMVFHGDQVKKGQVLAILEHPNYIALQEDFAEAAHNLDFLQEDYKRQKELYENEVGSGRDFQKVKSEFNIAKAKYEGLKSRLQMLDLNPEKVKNGVISNTIRVVSPIRGYVNEIDIKVGKYVDASDELFSITNNQDIHADFQVYEKDVHLLEIGQKIHFTASSVPAFEFTAKIFAIGKEFEENTRAVHIHASLEETTGNLVPGMYISGHLHTDDSYTNTLPNDAIVKEGTKSFIFVLKKEKPEEANKHLKDSIMQDGHDHSMHEDDIDEIRAVDKNNQSFRMVEIMTGQSDDEFTEVQLIDSLPDNSQIVLNAAYYLLADMKKEETEHKH